jgi:hypothetical protein
MTEELLTSDNHNLSVIENNINHYFTKTIPIQKSYEEAKQFLEDLKLFTPYLLWWNNYNSVHILNESELKIIEPEQKMLILPTSGPTRLIEILDNNIDKKTIKFKQFNFEENEQLVKTLPYDNIRLKQLKEDNQENIDRKKKIINDKIAEIKASAEAEKLAQKTEENRLAQKAEAEKLAQEAALVKKQLEAERLKRESKEKQKERLALFALKGMGGKRIRSRKMRKTNKKGTSKRRKTSRRRR